jgi:hypothetical protein
MRAARYLEVPNNAQRRAFSQPVKLCHNPVGIQKSSRNPRSSCLSSGSRATPCSCPMLCGVAKHRVVNPPTCAPDQTYGYMCQHQKLVICIREMRSTCRELRLSVVICRCMLLRWCNVVAQYTRARIRMPRIVRRKANI